MRASLQDAFGGGSVATVILAQHGVPAVEASAEKVTSQIRASQRQSTAVLRLRLLDLAVSRFFRSFTSQPLTSLSRALPLAMDSSAVSRAPSPAPTPRHIPSLPSLLPAPAAPPAKRTNLVELKLRLAELLTPEQGAVYWAGLGDFVCGRINRQEWDEVLKRAFGKDRARRAEAGATRRFLDFVSNHNGADCPASSPQSSCTTLSSSRYSTTRLARSSLLLPSDTLAFTHEGRRSAVSRRAKVAKWRKRGGDCSRTR